MNGQEVTVDINRPLAGLMAPAMAGVLEVITATHTPLTGREVHRLARGDVSLGAVQRALSDLSGLGLINVQPAGRANLYVFNRDHVLADAIVELASGASTFEAWLAQELRSWPCQPRAAWLFGSTARGDTHADSDIDIVLVQPAEVEPEAWNHAISDLGDRVLRRTGNPAEVLEWTVDDLREAARRDDPIIGELRRDARLLTGEHPRALLKAQP